MIISLGLIMSVAFYDVPAWTLLLLLTTWLPDVVLIMALKGDKLQ